MAAGVAGLRVGRAGWDATGRLYHVAAIELLATGPLPSKADSSWSTGALVPIAHPQSWRVNSQGLLEKFPQKR